VNRVPKLRTDDPAAWSRLRIIPFAVSFRDKADRHLKTVLRGELPGILMWALRGCLLWKQEGLGSVAAIEHAKKMTYKGMLA
jgi:putative DNA primase/helicase